MPTKKGNLIVLSPEEIQYIKDNWETRTNPQLADDLGLRLTRLRYFLAEMGLKRIEMEYWTPEQVDFLKSNYKKMGDIELSEIFEAEWPKNKKWTEKHIRKKRCYLNLHRTEKQVEAVRRRNVKAGRYNTANQRWKTTGVTEVGTIKIWNHKDKKSFPVIKLPSGFVHYYRWLWVSTYGELPSDHCVVKKIGVNESVLLTIDELEVLPRQEAVRRNKISYMNLPEETREIIKLTNRLKRTIKKHENDQRNETEV